MVESLREREVLYKLIISQLRYDGLDMVAANLAKCVGLETTPLSPSSRLLGIMKLGLQEEKNGIVPEIESAPGLAPVIPPAHGMDLEYETEKPTIVGRQVTHACTNIDNRLKQGLKRKADTFEIDCCISEDEKDLNMQPTLIACKINGLLVERGFHYNEDKNLNNASTVQHECEVNDEVKTATVVMPECNAALEIPSECLQHDYEANNENEIVISTSRHCGNECDDLCGNKPSGIRDERYENGWEQRLEVLVSFDPKNKGKLTDLSCPESLHHISEIFNQYREKFKVINLKDLVSSEVLKVGINQSIFSKTVLGRSQGYLSDLLNRQDAIISVLEPTRMFANFVKIKQFLELSESERRLRYMDCVKANTTTAEKRKLNDEIAEQSKISPRKRRVKISSDVKGKLRLLFKDVSCMPSYEDLLEIARKFNLEIQTIKNFYRNYKSRSKLMDNS
eukprot:gene806-101_t